MKPSHLLPLPRQLRRALKTARISLLAPCLALFFPAGLQAQLVLNEVMATNQTVLANPPDGAIFPDWIELYNGSQVTMDIGGYFLTDTPTNTTKFMFPAHTFMSPKAHLLVFCDPANTVAPGFHSGFSLKSSGEFVGLYAPDGFSQLDSITFGIQIPDLSIGRVPDGGTWTLNQPTPRIANEAKPLGPLANLFLNEWMATNSSGSDWLEIYNPSNAPVALAGVVLSSDLPPAVPLNRPIPALSFIDAAGFLQLKCVGNKAKSADELDFKLSHTSGETVTFYPAAGMNSGWLDQISFPGNVTSSGYWIPDESYGRLPDGAANIVAFAPGKTTPGASNFQPITNVVINEALSHTDPPLEDAIELWNPTTGPVDISNWWLSNQRDNPKKFRIPPGTVIAAGGYKVFYEQRGVATLPKPGFNTSGNGVFPDFTLNSAHGDSVYLFTADASPGGTLTGFRRGIDFPAAENGVSFGRYLTTAGADITPMSGRTFGVDNPSTVAQFRGGTGLTNVYPKFGPLIINEIMYHPPDLFDGTNFVDNGLDEYVEVYNFTTSSVSLYDTNGIYFDSSVGNYADGRTNTWKLKGSVSLDFPTNVHLGAGQFLLLVNFDPKTNNAQSNLFAAKYSVPRGVQMFGPYTGGKLKNGGGTVELDRPDPPQGPAHPDFQFVPHIQVDKVNYNDHLPWPLGADGTGYALQRLVPERYGNEPTNWVAAAPTPGWQPLRINSAQPVANVLVLGFSGLAGSSYSVQYKTNLEAGGWTRLTNLAALTNSGLRQVTNNLTATNRFYRLVTPSQ